MKILRNALPLALAWTASAAVAAPTAVEPDTVRVVPANAVNWTALNPLRGDKSPRAGTLWGDRGAEVPSGFLVKFVDGFSSPPHIHPVTYRGVVISGQVHNDLPTAKEEWLPPGSFWVQPSGQVHITAAKGPANVAYIEIEKGPYLVKPSKAAFTPPEALSKVAPTKMSWADAIAGKPAGPKVAALSGNPKDPTIKRALIKLPAGFSGVISGAGTDVHATVITGHVKHPRSKVALDPGSYFGSTKKGVAHSVACDKAAECLVYVRTNGDLSVAAAK